MTLSFNEIKTSGGVAVAKAMENKVNLEKLELDGKHFFSIICPRLIVVKAKLFDSYLKLITGLVSVLYCGVCEKKSNL